MPSLTPGTEDKLRDIRSVTDAALSHLDADELLATLLGRVREILDADTAAVLLLDSSGRQLIATAASGLEEEVSQGVRVPVGRGFAGRIAAGRRPVILDHVDHGNVLNPLLLDKGIQSLAGVPLLVHGAVLGVLHVGTVHDRVFTADDAALLQLAADRAALAVQSLRSREDQAAALALQRSLVPSALPAVAGAEVAARYVPGSGRAALGRAGHGGGRRLGFRAGRCGHHGPHPQRPARVRAGVPRPGRCAGQAGPQDAVLRAGQCHGHRVLRRARPGLRAAGHLLGGPPPAGYRRPGQGGAVAQIAVDPPIGVTDAARRQVTTRALAPGTVLCLFTDGLVERRDEPIDDGITRLCQTATPGPPEGVCASIMHALVGRQYPGDDIRSAGPALATRASASLTMPAQR